MRTFEANLEKQLNKFFCLLRRAESVPTADGHAYLILSKDSTGRDDDQITIIFSLFAIQLCLILSILFMMIITILYGMIINYRKD